MKKKKLKSYMVSVTRTITLTPTVYVEVVAGSNAEAVMLAKKISISDDDFFDECKIDLEFGGIQKISKSQYFSSGESSQYHPKDGCSVCLSADGVT